MPDLSYSDDALNVRNAFFRAKAIVYVEGEDDVLFWHGVFSKVTDEPFEVESLGGAPALDEHIAKIATGKLQGIAARDADFLPLLGKCNQSPRILYTFGYSIENSLYTATTLAQLVRVWCKSPRISVDECADWLRSLADKVGPLVNLDAANAISAAGVATVGDNCGRYMTSRHSASICPHKVAADVSAITPKISAHAIATVDEIIKDKDAALVHLRGHFLASAVHRYIVSRAKAFGKKVSLSTESLYAAAIVQFVSSMDAEHPHKGHYVDSARTAWQAI
jgi:Protein of unknown function (DUF4435)